MIGGREIALERGAGEQLASFALELAVQPRHAAAARAPTSRTGALAVTGDRSDGANASVARQARPARTRESAVATSGSFGSAAPIPRERLTAGSEAAAALPSDVCAHADEAHTHASTTIQKRCLMPRAGSSFVPHRPAAEAAVGRGE